MKTETTKYKKLIQSFNTSDFGEYTAEIFVKGNKYRRPTVYPFAERKDLNFIFLLKRQ